MKGMKLAAAAALLLAQGARSAAEPATKAGSGDPNEKKICHVETDLGTRLGGKRICRTAAEWAQVRAEARRTVERIQQGPSVCAPPMRC
jgi:hypothetical protein